MFLVTDLRMNNAFFEDMCAQGVISTDQVKSEQAGEPNEKFHEGFAEGGGASDGSWNAGKAVCTERKETGECDSYEHDIWCASQGRKINKTEMPQGVPGAGSITKRAITEFLPELMRVSNAAEG